MAVETNFVMLWEFDPDAGLRLTRSVDDPLPVSDYLEAQGKYRHLSPEQVAHIAAGVAKQTAFIKRLERKDEPVRH